MVEPPRQRGARAELVCLFDYLINISLAYNMQGNIRETLEFLNPTNFPSTHKKVVGRTYELADCRENLYHNKLRKCRSVYLCRLSAAQEHQSPETWPELLQLLYSQLDGMNEFDRIRCDF